MQIAETAGRSAALLLSVALYHLRVTCFPPEFEPNLNSQIQSSKPPPLRIFRFTKFAVRCCAITLAAVCLLLLIGLQSTAVLAQEITFARPSATSAITINGQQISRWQSGNFEVLHVQGNAEVRQKDIFASANEAIIWVELPSDDAADFYATTASPKTHRIIVYMENNVVVELDSRGAVNQNSGGRRDRIEDQQWLGQLVTQSTVDLGTSAYSLPDTQRPPIFDNALRYAFAAGVTAVDPRAPSNNQNIKKNRFRSRRSTLLAILPMRTGPTADRPGLM